LHLVTEYTFNFPGARYELTEINLWQAETGEEICALRGHSDAVYSIVFSPDGKTLASAGVDGTIKLWELSTGKELCTLTGHSGVIYSIAFSPDGKTIVSGSHDKTIKVWRCH
jgi:WD40 repeat protein